MTEKYGRSFAGKVALVTGGSRGIGEGIVRRLASDGAAVAFTYFNSEEKAKRLASEIDAAGGKALPIKADSASAEDIRATVNQVVKELGEIDIFVNNAGILIRGAIDSYSLEDFDRMLAVNVRAAFVGMQAASQSMKDGGWRTDHPDRQQHCRSDSISGSERLQHDQSGPDRIGARRRYRSRSSGDYGQYIQPGPTATDMSAPHAEAVKGLIPLARMAHVSEIAGFVSYLASDEAGFITGASLTIDGGYIA